MSEQQTDFSSPAELLAAADPNPERDVAIALGAGVAAALVLRMLTRGRRR